MSEKTEAAPAQEPPKADVDGEKSVADIIYPEKKPEESASPEPQKEEPAKEESKEAKPEEFELKLPKDAVLDESNVKEFAEYAKQKGISKELAQEILERENTSVLSFKKAQDEQITNEIKGWAEAAKADKEIGGDNFNKSVELAKRAIDRWGTPEFKQALDKGLGNHPEAIRVFSRIGKELLADDTLVVPNQNVKGEKSTAELFYPSNK